jgi:hypothetical protein
MKKASLPEFHGIKPKKTGSTVLWKKGAFEARAWPTTVPVKKGIGVFWGWEWTIGGRQQSGSSRVGLEGCIVHLENSLEQEQGISIAHCRILEEVIGPA